MTPVALLYVSEREVQLEVDASIGVADLTVFDKTDKATKYVALTMSRREIDALIAALRLAREATT